jgi:hypothetical protein
MRARVRVGLAVAAVLGAASAPACTLLLPNDSELSTSSGEASTTTGSGSSSSSGAGGGVDFGSLPDCHGSGHDGYHIYSTKDFTPTIDAGEVSCADFRNAPLIVFQGACSSDNRIACRLLWDINDNGRMYGCCEVGDHALWTVSDASAADQDPLGDVWEWWIDDALEYYVSPETGPDAGFGDASLKVALDLNGRKFDGLVVDEQSDTDAGYNGDLYFYRKLVGHLNGGVGDQGYIFKWEVTVPFPITDGMVGGCDFLLYDRDNDAGGAVTTQAYAFGTSVNGFNQPSNWGTCTFHANPPPGGD